MTIKNKLNGYTKLIAFIILIGGIILAVGRNIEKIVNNEKIVNENATSIVILKIEVAKNTTILHRIEKKLDKFIDEKK